MLGRRATGVEAAQRGEERRGGGNLDRAATGPEDGRGPPVSPPFRIRLGCQLVGASGPPQSNSRMRGHMRSPPAWSASRIARSSAARTRPPSTTRRPLTQTRSTSSAVAL